MPEKFDPTKYEERWKNTPPEAFTCHKCEDRNTCPFVDDLYNTGGECLAMK